MEGHSRALSPSRCRSRGGCWSAWSAASVSMAAVRPQQPRPWCHARHSGHTSTPPCGVQASAPGVWDTRAFLCTAFAGVVWVFVLGAGAGACPSGAHTVSGRRAWERAAARRPPRPEARGAAPSWVPEPSARARRQVAIYLLRSVISSLLSPQLLGHSPPHGRPQKTPATARRGRAGRVSGGLFPVVPVLSLHLPGPRSAGGRRAPRGRGLRCASSLLWTGSPGRHTPGVFPVPSIPSARESALHGGGPWRACGEWRGRGGRAAKQLSPVLRGARAGGEGGRQVAGTGGRRTGL